MNKTQFQLQNFDVHNLFTSKVRTALITVDGIINYLVRRLIAEDLMSCINLILISDHGLSSFKIQFKLLFLEEEKNIRLLFLNLISCHKIPKLVELFNYLIYAVPLNDSVFIRYATNG